MAASPMAVGAPIGRSGAVASLKETIRRGVACVRHVPYSPRSTTTFRVDASGGVRPGFTPCRPFRRILE